MLGTLKVALQRTMILDDVTDKFTSSLSESVLALNV